MNDKDLPKKSRRGALRNKILLMMALVGLVPLAATGILARISISRFHEFDLASLERITLAEKRDDIKGFVDAVLDIFELQVSFENKSDIKLEDQHFLLGQILQYIPELEELSFINLSGLETSRTLRDHGLVKKEDLKDQSLSKKFREALSDKPYYISPVHFTLQGPTVTISHPVKNKNNENISVLTGELKLTELQGIITRARLGETGYLYLLDQDGYAIAHGKNHGLIAPVPRHLASFAEAAGKAEPYETSRYLNLFGEEVIGSKEIIDEYGLTLVAEWPASDADKILLSVERQLIINLSLVLIAVLLLSLFLAGRIVGPIKKLEAGTLRVAEGKFDEPVALQTGDEIEDLGAAFNKMMSGLKRLEELKEEFVFVAAHELRTPVTAIKGYLSMVKDGEAGPVSDGVKSLIVKVIDANQRLIQLVNDLLQVARSEAGRLAIQVEALDIAGIVSLILGELKPLAQEKNISLVYDPPKDMPKVMADAQRLKEVVVNLVGNAVKYTTNAGTVTVNHEIKGSELVTHIKDTGIGISKDAQARLFEKFYRVQTEETKEITGTGLGLFIVKQIIEKMNGRIWVESETGKGSTFSFSLPLEKKDGGVGANIVQ